MEPKPTVRRRGEKKSKGDRRPRDNEGQEREHRERVVRDTISFSRPSPEPTNQSQYNRPSPEPSSSGRAAPSIVKPVPTYTPAAAKKSASDDDDDDDGYGDDFEDYDDDFDDDEESSVPSRRHSSSSNVPKLTFSSSKEDAEMKQIRTSVELENSNAFTRQNNRTPSGLSASPSPTPFSSSEAKMSKYGSNFSRDDKAPLATSKTTSTARKHSSGLMGFASKQSIAFAPRMKRLEALRNSGVLNMTDDRSLQLSIAPSSAYEFYHRQLFSSVPPIAQTGVPIEISSRDIDANTDEITTVDKEMQYVYGDDTTLLNAIAKVKEKKKGENKIDVEEIEDYHTQTIDPDATANEKYNSNRLSSFLQASSQLCEDLIQEQANAMSSKLNKSKGAPKALFEDRGMENDTSWITFGGDKSEGSNELVRYRSVSSVSCSPLQAHLIMSSHPYREDDNEDLRPYKGIYCIWSTAMPGSPSVVLEATGQPTCCSFSGSQTFIVVGGTAEGTLHVWDLRESNSLHANRDTLDLRIAKGLRKPCYSTHRALSPEADGHSSPIVQVEALSSGSGDDAAASISQFISMDASGKAILWVTSQASTDTVVASDGFGKDLDFGLSPWGKTRLLQQRTLDVDRPSQMMKGSLNLNFLDDSSFPKPQTCLSVIPGNTSSFLFSVDGGLLKRVVRYGSSKSKEKSRDRWCVDFCRQQRSAIHLVPTSESKSDHLDPSAPLKAPLSYQPRITSLAVNNSPIFDSLSGEGEGAAASSVAPLVLAGRTDGSIDLFRLDASEPIQSWDLSSYSVGSSKTLNKGEPVVYLQWATWGAVGSFLAADSIGNIFYFDILKEPGRPTFFETTSSSLSLNSVRLSSCRSKGMSVYIIVGNRDAALGNGALSMRKINGNLTTSESEDPECKDLEEERSVPPHWASWAGRSAAEVVPWTA